MNLRTLSALVVLFAASCAGCEPEPATDAGPGVDAAHADVASSDAWRADAVSTDSSRFDAHAVDGRVADSTTVDSARADAAHADGAVVDSGFGDIVVVDGASVDSATSVDASSADAGSACQALDNGDFEVAAGAATDPPAGWSLAYPSGTTVVGVDGDWTLDSAVVAHGVQSLRVHPVPDHTFILYQGFYLYQRSGGAALDVDVAVDLRQRGLLAAQPLGVVVLAQSATDSTMHSSLSLASSGPSETWQHLDGTVHVDVSAIYLHVLIAVAGSAGDDLDGQGWVDNLLLTPRPCLTPRACSLVESSTPLSRAGAVPAGHVKIDPADDPRPPLLNPAFRYHPIDNPGGEWTDPVPLDGPINTAGAEDSPFIADDDDNTVYFWFSPLIGIDPVLQILWPEEGVWSVSRSWSGSAWVWGEPQKVWLFDTVAGEGCEYVHGDRMLFCGVACGFPTTSGIDWFESTRSSGSWSMAALSPAPFNDPAFKMGELHISTDQNQVEWIYFHSNQLAGGLGGMELWVTRNDDGVWSAPINLGSPVNTAGDEGYPYLTPDGLELWITANLTDPTIYRSTRQGWDAVNQVWTWSTPDLILSRYAGEATLDAQRNIYFTHHLWDVGAGGIAESDIYVARHR